MKQETKTLGVIGGLGPMATAHFMELIIGMTEASCDQEHLNMIVYNTPSIPDRTQYILDHTKPSPLPEMVAVGKRLAEQGVSCLAIPCITAHYFHRELTEAIPVPILHMVEETVAHLKEHGVQAAGIMATDGTLTAGLFQKELERCGIRPVVPSEDGRRHVMSVIFDNIKANLPADMERFCAAEQELRAAGAEAVILGCTELSLIKKTGLLGGGFIDAMEVLAQKSVLACGGNVKAEYRHLITE